MDWQSIHCRDQRFYWPAPPKTAPTGQPNYKTFRTTLRTSSRRSVQPELLRQLRVVREQVGDGHLRQQQYDVRVDGAAAI